LTEVNPLPVEDLLRGLRKAVEKRRIREFNSLVPQAAKLHPFTFCVKLGMPVLTERLRGEECVRCKHFILNGGVCDPL